MLRHVLRRTGASAFDGLRSGATSSSSSSSAAAAKRAAAGGANSFGWVARAPQGLQVQRQHPWHGHSSVRFMSAIAGSSEESLAESVSASMSAQEEKTFADLSPEFVESSSSSSSAAAAATPTLLSDSEPSSMSSSASSSEASGSGWWTQDPSDLESAANAASVLSLQDPDPSALGWGPMDMAQWAIDYFHMTSGMPWWMSIVTVTCILRMSMFPLTVTQMRNQIRMAQMSPDIQALQKRMEERPADTQEQQLAYRKEMVSIQQKHGVKVWTSILPALAQIPVFLTMFWTLRDMASDYPSFQDGGTLWFTNLAETDPTYGLPILCATTFIAMTELNPQPESGNQEQAARMKMIMRVMAVAMVPITMTQPSAIAVYWTATNLFSLSQSLLFRIPGIKPALGISLRPEIAARAAATPTDAGTGVASNEVFSTKPRRTRFSRRQ
mmetsp:Transcript_12600/g.24433  ORF Transcript_12600/g.24433 Transcript_12600/m.24433 type:complete len:441 (-) Transcript_12600:46-1368(-)